MLHKLTHIIHIIYIHQISSQFNLKIFKNYISVILNFTKNFKSSETAWNVKIQIETKQPEPIPVHCKLGNANVSFVIVITSKNAP